MIFHKKKASILLWSIFLLTFLAFSFLYVSKNISSQISKTDTYESPKYDFLNNTWNLNDSENDETYSYSSTNFYTGVLRNGENVVYTWITSQINFSVVPWWWAGLIYYSGSTSTGLYSNWFVSNDTWDLYIESRAWFVNYTISSANPFFSKNREYSIEKNIWWNTIIKSIWEK